MATATIDRDVLAKNVGEKLQTLDQQIHQLITDWKSYTAPDTTIPGDSPDGTMVTKINTPLIVNGVRFTITAAKKILADGKPPTDPDYTSDVTALMKQKGVVYHENLKGEVYELGDNEWKLFSAPKPEPSTPTTGQDVINTAQIVIDDMQKGNDDTLLSYEGVPYGWMRDPSKSPDPAGHKQWTLPYGIPNKPTADTVVSWWVVFPFVGNKAKNAAVKSRLEKLWGKRKDNGKWDMLAEIPDGATSGDYFGLPKHPTLPNQRVIQGAMLNGSGATKLLAEETMALYHAYGCSKQGFDPTQYVDYQFTVKAKLVLADPNGVNDLHLAEYGLQPGMDYYKQAGWIYCGGLTLARTKLLTPYEQPFSATTFKNAGADDTGSPGGHVTTEDYRNNHPVFE